MQFREWRSSGGIAVTIYNTLRVHKGEAKKLRIFRTSPCDHVNICFIFHIYRVFTAIGKQERGCYKLILTLLRAQRASMSPQDWAQITFRSEMHLNDLNNESGS